MKIIVDRPSWSWRAGDTDHAYARHQLTRLPRYEPDVTVSVLGGPRSLAVNAAGVARAVRRKSPLGSPAPTWSHRRRIGAGADVVLSNDAFPLRSSRPVVWQNTMLSPEMRLSRGDSWADIDRETRLKRPLFDAAARIVVSTAAERERITASFPEVAGRIEDCPFLLPALEGVEAAIDRHEAPGPVRVLFVGNQARRKGLPELVAALGALPAAVRRDTRLTVVSRFLDGAVDLPVDVVDEVVEGAPHAKVLDLMGRAHVLADPARFESYGFVFIEAFATGAVALGPDWEAQRELFAGGDAGVLADRDSLVEQLHTLITDPSRRTVLAATARRHFEERFAPGVVAARLRTIFEAARLTA